VRDETSSTALLHVDRLDVADDGETGTFDGDCFIENGEPGWCLSQLGSLELGPMALFAPLVQQLAADGINLGAINRDGRWYLSLTQTLLPYSPALESIGAELEELAGTCRGVMFGGGFGDIPEECAAFLAPFGLFGAGASGGGFGYESTVPV
jgi:hypothetical protein